MNFSHKTKTLILFAGDIIALYASLFLSLILRYGNGFYDQFRNSASPFTIVFAFSILVFYISGLYDLRRLRNNIDFTKTLTLAIFVNGLLATVFFYFLPASGIAPKINLFLFVVVFLFIEFSWRRSFNKLASSGDAPNQVLLIGNSAAADEVSKLISANPQFGYRIAAHLPESEAHNYLSVRDTTQKNNINVIVIPRRLKHNANFTNELYKLLSRGVEIYDLAYFYELILKKVPLAEIDETWFLEHLANRSKFYDQLKRGCEIILAILLQIMAIPLEAIIAFGILVTSSGPIIYKQTRVGKGGTEFTLYKFRTMRTDAEKNGAQWSEENDDRVTLFGKFLRWTHFDELPQLINIIKGNISFVGPRPERPEFVNMLKEKIPYFEIRHIVLPGITGWAQINHHYNATDADSYEKLQHDIYYIKNRSIILDFAIIIKTVKAVFVNHE